jgi:serine/threonine-protein kinase HipA
MNALLRLDDFTAVHAVRVTLDGRRVGTLAATGDEGAVAFEYDSAWLASGFAISPFSLPLQRGVKTAEWLPFEGLHGAFNDSLPDGWGRLLVDRMLRRHSIDPQSVSSLQRLAIVGSSGMGALCYEPEFEHNDDTVLPADLDALAAECKRLLDGEFAPDLDELFALGGSSGGARPKILTQVNGEDWIIKFPSSVDTPNAGLMEYEYAIAAKASGIDMPDIRLFPSKKTAGYFGVRRFDRTPQSNGNIARVHMLSLSALLETTHRIPNLDYSDIFRVSLRLSDDYQELARLYRLMCFNVLVHNRDDHSKNFSYIYDQAISTWRLSPAYDLTFNPGMGGEHATTVAGKGTGITNDDLISCGKAAGLSTHTCKSILLEVQEATSTLANWLE